MRRVLELLRHGRVFRGDFVEGSIRVGLYVDCFDVEDIGGGTAGVCACTARGPASTRDNPATELNQFFMSAHLPGAIGEIVKLEGLETFECRGLPRMPRFGCAWRKSPCQAPARRAEIGAVLALKNQG